MMRKIVGVLGLLSLVVIQSEGGAAAQDALAPVRLAAATVGTTTRGTISLKSLRYSGSGSSYTFGTDEEGNETRHYQRVSDFVAEIDDQNLTERIQAAGQDTRTIGPDSPWESQVELWMDPHVFLMQAMTSGNVETQTVEELGVEYTEVRFETPGGHTLLGYIDPDHTLRRVQTVMDDPDLGGQILEASYLYYQDFDGVMFPTVMIHKQNGKLKLVLTVTEVTHESI